MLALKCRLQPTIEKSVLYVVVQALLRPYYGFIVIAQIGQDALLTAGMIVDTDALPMPQQSLVEIVDGLRVIWK